MSWPYVAQDPGGGWYGDCEGVMQNGDPNRTQVEAMQWCIDRLAHSLGAARHGCEMQVPYCLLHVSTFDKTVVDNMRGQLLSVGIALPGWRETLSDTLYAALPEALRKRFRMRRHPRGDGRIIRRYEAWRRAAFPSKSNV